MGRYLVFGYLDPEGHVSGRLDSSLAPRNKTKAHTIPLSLDNLLYGFGILSQRDGMPQKGVCYEPTDRKTGQQVQTRQWHATHNAAREKQREVVEVLKHVDYHLFTGPIHISHGSLQRGAKAT